MTGKDCIDNAASQLKASMPITTFEKIAAALVWTVLGVVMITMEQEIGPGK